MTSPPDDKKDELFKAAMRGVKPLRDDEIRPHQPTRSGRQRKRRPLEQTPLQLPPLSDHLATEVGPETVLSFQQPDLPARRMRQLRHGQISIGASLDLHGKTIAESKQLLYEFLEHNQQANIRCVRVVHGKGFMAVNPARLKNHVFSWLQQLPSVLACHSCLPQHGGNGAVYVLLRQIP